MKTNMFALATVAALASAPVYAQSNTSQGLDMLTGSLFHSFTAMGIPTDELNNLSLRKIASIKNLLEDDDVAMGDRKRRVLLELEKE